MAFDAEGYRQAAKEAGISDDVIKRTIAEQSAGVKDVATKPTQQDVSVEMFPNLVKQVMEYAPEAIGAYLGYKALTSDTAKSVGKSIKDRMIGAPKEPARIEPTMEGPKEPTFSPPSKVGPITNMPGTPEELQKALGPNWEATLAKSEAARKEKQMLAQERARTSMGEIPAPVAQPPVAAPQPSAPSPVAQAAAQTAPVAPPTVAQIAQQAAPAVAEAAQAPAATIPPATEEKAKTRKPKTKLTYEAGSQLPEGMVFKEGFGGADNWMKNSFNDESRIMIRDLFNEGKPYGQNMEKAYGDARKYEDWLKQNIPVQTYARTERKAAGLPPPENYGKLGTAIKVGGIGGLLMTAGQAANAKQAVQDVGEALLPIGMTPSDLASGTLTEKQLRAYQEAQKLGSPYRSVPPPR